MAASIAMAMLTATAAGMVSGPALPAFADTAVIREYPIPTTGQTVNGPPTGITKGSDGNVWFTDYDAHMVGRLTPGGVVTEFGPTLQPPSAITLGGDGNVWFIETDGNTGFIGRLTPLGQLTEFSVPSVFDNSGLNGGAFVSLGITLGPDGNVWYIAAPAAFPGYGVGRITPTGQTAEFPLPVGDQPLDLTAGADGNIWISLESGPALAHISTTGTDYTVLPLPPSGGFQPTSFPHGITTGPDGNVWYVTNTNKVGRVTPGGAFTEFRIPTTFAQPSDITTGPDGNLWFTEFFGNRVARVTPAGDITEFLLPHANSRPTGITSGPAGKVWFAEPGNGTIGSIDPATITPTPAPCLTVTRSITLTRDVGPCAGDGIAVTASNVSVNLNGHKVFAGPGRRVGDFAGIHLKGVSNVAVIRGAPGAQVTGFDAGVWIDGGSNNVIRDLNIHDNLSPPDNVSKLGDGIILFHSSGNLIDHNVVAHNGVFDGIGVLGLDSNRNTISNNDVHDNTDEGIGNDQPGAGTGIIVDAFLEFEAVGRGASISANNVIGNTVRNNVSSGISSISNTDSQIRSNTVDHNGFNPDGSAGNPMGNGIGVTNDMGATRLTRNTVTYNTVTANFGAGIQVGSDSNNVSVNRVFGNGMDGIQDFFGHNNRFAANTATGNTGFDLHDRRQSRLFPPCDSNVWIRNTYGTADPACTTNGGHQVATPALAAPAAAAKVQAATSEPLPSARRGQPANTRGGA